MVDDQLEIFTLSGTGLLDWSDKLLVGYNIVVNGNTSAGGGYIFGVADDVAVELENSEALTLDIGSNSFVIATGKYWGRELPIIVIGQLKATAESAVNQA